MLQGSSKFRELRGKEAESGFFFFWFFNFFLNKKKKRTKKTGFVFVHTNQLGSVTSFTDGNGDLVTGGQFEGASDIKYLPYGTIDQKNSKGPKLSAFTYTGQREETTTGLMYYNFRFYDPSIGRFISPDDRIFPDKISGMNRYAYVDGNPIMQNDPTGHKGNAWVHMSNQLIKRGMKEVVFQAERAFIQSLSPELRMALGFLSSGGKINFGGKKKSGVLNKIESKGNKLRESSKKYLNTNLKAGELLNKGINLDLGLKDFLNTEKISADSLRMIDKLDTVNDRNRTLGETLEDEFLEVFFPAKGQKDYEEKKKKDFVATLLCPYLGVDPSYCQMIQNGFVQEYYHGDQDEEVSVTDYWVMFYYIYCDNDKGGSVGYSSSGNKDYTPASQVNGCYGGK